MLLKKRSWYTGYFGCEPMVHAAASQTTSQCIHGNNSIMTVTCFDPLISPGVFSLYNSLSLEYLAACARLTV